jgi:hypothetical protein
MHKFYSQITAPIVGNKHKLLIIYSYYSPHIPRILITAIIIKFNYSKQYVVLKYIVVNGRC